MTAPWGPRATRKTARYTPLGVAPLGRGMPTPYARAHGTPRLRR